MTSKAPMILGNRVQIEPKIGALLVIRGDLLHAGSGYEKAHMRTHWYIDSGKIL
jgi:hypothetical protein